MAPLDLALRKLDSAKDVAALQQVLESARRYSLNVSGAPQPRNAAEKVFSALPDNFVRSQKHVYGIYLDSILVGCVDVLRGFPTEDTAMIGLLLLSEAHQGKGLGKSAYQALESIFLDWAEILLIRISVIESNGEVLGFWKKMGFIETGVRRPYESGSVKSEVIILEKRLADFLDAPSRIDYKLPMRKVIKSYDVVYPNAIRVMKGMSLEILREETNPAWDGWLWCRSEDGQEGWISTDYMNIDGTTATMLRDYDAREVAVLESDIVDVLKEERGWSWVKTSDGSEGWIPSENLE